MKKFTNFLLLTASAFVVTLLVAGVVGMNF